jgi:hypothetical protein
LFPPARIKKRVKKSRTAYGKEQDVPMHLCDDLCMHMCTCYTHGEGKMLEKKGPSVCPCAIWRDTYIHTYAYACTHEGKRDNETKYK